MKKFITLCILLLLSSVAYAQSDCYATNCGMVPMMHFNNQEGGVTTLYLYYDSDCNIYFRTRFSSIEGNAPNPNFYQVPSGEHRFIIDSVMGAWTGYEATGTFIIDWATYDCIPEISAAGIYRNGESGGPFGSAGNRVYYNIYQPKLFQPGCHTFYADENTTARFHIYNEDDLGIQIVNHQGEYLLVQPRQTIEIVEPWSDYFFEICFGEQPPGPSLPGTNLGLPLYIEGLSVNPEGDVHEIIHLN